MFGDRSSDPMTDNQFRFQFLRQQEEEAIERDRQRLLPSWERRQASPPVGDVDLGSIIKTLKVWFRR
jgi:hypothetical protein